VKFLNFFFTLHKAHRQYYYELLNEVRQRGNWEAWLDFFSETVMITANQALDTTRQLTDLSKRDRDKIKGLGRAAPSTLQVHRALLERPISTAGWLVKKTAISPATVNKCLNHLELLELYLN